MSFSRDCKTELCRLELSSSLETFYEFESMLRIAFEYNITSDGTTISFETSNPLVAKRFLELLKNLYNANTTIETHKLKRLNQDLIYRIIILDQIDSIVDELSLFSEFKHSDEIEDNLDYAKAYLRGAFLAKGSVNDPVKADYHLEIPVTSQDDVIFLQHIANNFDLNMKIVKRRNDYVLYLKNISKICDFLRIIGVSGEVFKLEELLVKREYKANINRKMNSEIANQMKTLQASHDQLKYIEYLEYNYPLEKMDKKTLLVMKVRKDNPDSSFKELENIINERYQIQMTKSGLNHQFIKIKNMALDLMEKNKK